MNVALAAATQWLFNLIVSRTVPNMIATLGDHGYGTFLLFGSFCFSMFFFVWFLVPETKGVSLEHMDRLFGVKEYDQKLEGDAAERKQAATQVQIENVPAEKQIERAA